MSRPVFHIIIPARLASSRLPEKALADLGGKPMVVRVAERAAESGAAGVTVATDHAAIADACAAHGVAVVMTGAHHDSGTSRLAEAAGLLGLADSDLVVNVQGDEPLIDTDLVRETAALAAASAAPMATAACPIGSLAEFLNPNCVKLVCDATGRALYFSRAPIPYPRDAFAADAAVLPSELPVWRHIGLYVYRAGFLRTYAALPPSPLEKAESLEQLRVLWHGYSIAVLRTDKVPQAGVDTAEDLRRVRALFVGS